MTSPAPHAKIAALAERARRDRQTFEPPASPPDEEAAMTYLREGFGEAVWCYVQVRSGEPTRLPPETYERLERAANTWLELYARCHGTSIEAEIPIRTAAEALLDTHNIADVARVLTGIPQR